MHRFPRPSHLLILAALLFPLVGHAANGLELFGHGRPPFKPEKYFAGHTHSWGVFESRSGAPTRLIYTKTSGRWDGAALHFEQDLDIAGKKQHRSWLIHRLDEHHYVATGTGIVGQATGVTSGNAFHLDFTIDAVPGNPLAHLHMSQWMYFQADGVTMVNRDTLTKAGIIVTEITEQFRKDD